MESMLVAEWQAIVSAMGWELCCAKHAGSDYFRSAWYKTTGCPGQLRWKIQPEKGVGCRILRTFSVPNTYWFLFVHNKVWVFSISQCHCEAFSSRGTEGPFSPCGWPFSYNWRCKAEVLHHAEASRSTEFCWNGWWSMSTVDCDKTVPCYCVRQGVPLLSWTEPVYWAL